MIDRNTQELALANFSGFHYTGTSGLDVEFGNLGSGEWGGMGMGGGEELLIRYHLFLGSSRTPSLNLTSTSLDSLW